MASRPMISSVCITAILLLLLYLTLIAGAAGRPEPVLPPGETRYEDVGGERFHVEEENCEGVGEEECLMRRTLAAHTDYIYTQKNIRP